MTKPALITVNREQLESRHELVCEQLEVMDGWLEHLPQTNHEARSRTMRSIVEFLQRYVLVDAAWEEERVFPLLPDRGSAFTTEHRYLERWVKELELLSHAGSDVDAARFRRVAYKLLGLLEAHMSAEETALQGAHARSVDLVGGVPAEIT